MKQKTALLIITVSICSLFFPTEAIKRLKVPYPEAMVLSISLSLSTHSLMRYLHDYSRAYKWHVKIFRCSGPIGDTKRSESLSIRFSQQSENPPLPPLQLTDTVSSSNKARFLSSLRRLRIDYLLIRLESLVYIRRERTFQLSLLIFGAHAGSRIDEGALKSANRWFGSMGNLPVVKPN